MIGNVYWSIGITLKWDGYRWSLSLDFYDSGWAQDHSTEGSLRCRYRVETIRIGDSLDTLIADAKKLGIEWCGTGGGPRLYVPEDGEGKSEIYHHEWRTIVAQQSARLGWDCVYRLTAQEHTQ